ncbi:MAG: glutathione S-transferase C-terminal domain-containing protein [Polyangiaceae bacterium]
MLVDGKWMEDWHPIQAKDARGGFVRQESSFRRWIGEPGLAPEAGRYRLIVSLTCPWASRTLIARSLKGLEDAIPVSVVEPHLSPRGWRFADGRALAEVYVDADAHYTGRATVPVLWDEKEHTIVSNESADIVRMLNASFGELARGDLDLYPERLRPEIDALEKDVYVRLNNGVYRAGFATTQAAHEDAVRDVFAMLDALEARLADRETLVGGVLTEADIRVFVTLVRFDLAYHGLFKCNLRRLADYPRLVRYVRRLLALPAFRDATNEDHIKRGYYSIAALNPSGIVPVGPLDPFGLGASDDRAVVAPVERPRVVRSPGALTGLLSP